MQTHALPGEPDTIRLFAAWPADWDVGFKLHAPCQTTVEGSFQSAKLARLAVTPSERGKDVVIVTPPTQPAEGHLVQRCSPVAVVK